jgi:hypothetical protein
MILKRSRLAVVFIFFLLLGCAGVSLHDNLSIPSGTIEGNQFSGIRYPFKVSAPSPWKMSTEFPSFLKKLGFDEPGPYDKEVTELYIYNPSTESNIQIDFTPASPGVKFSQQSIESLTTMATGSFTSEMEKDYGKGVKAEISPTTPYPLKGISYAAKKYGVYTPKDGKREQGWIYGYVEPYQLFILYMIKGNDEMKDRQTIDAILDSFEYVPPK